MSKLIVRTFVPLYELVVCIVEFWTYYAQGSLLALPLLKYTVISLSWTRSLSQDGSFFGVKGGTNLAQKSNASLLLVTKSVRQPPPP